MNLASLDPIVLALFVSGLFSTSTASAQFVLADDTSLGHQGGGDGAITPDGRYGIIREDTNNFTSARFYDLSTGSLLWRTLGSYGPLWGFCHDAVVCTNTRAAVAGPRLMIFDLTQLPGDPLMADVEVGARIRDMAITPDGRWLAVRGGNAISGGLPDARMAIFDLTTGLERANAPGEPTPYYTSTQSHDVDSVVVTNDHAVFTSLVDTVLGPRARVTIFRLNPSSGALPYIEFETDDLTDQLGTPHDLAISPDGNYCAVRSELEVGCYSLGAGGVSQLWTMEPVGQPGPFGNAVIDSIEMSNTRIATISRQSNPAYLIGAQIDLFDMAGSRAKDRVLGDPHDLVLDDSGRYLFVRTHRRLLQYDIENWMPGSQLQPKSVVVTVAGSHTGFASGVDSLDATDETLVTAVRDWTATTVYTHDFSGGALQEVGFQSIIDPVVDVEITPSGRYAAVSGLSSVTVIDTSTGTASLTHTVAGDGTWPWGDGVAVNDAQVLAWGGAQASSSGWTSIIDLFSAATSYCTFTPNSAGPGATLYAEGSPSLSSNDLVLRAEGAPPGMVGRFLFGTQTGLNALGDGFLCLAGMPLGFPVTTISSEGLASTSVDNTALPNGAGPFTAGTTWRFQLIYRDTAPAQGSGFNFSEGLEITFAP